MALQLAGDDTAELWLIDQPTGELTAFMQQVLQWTNSPFSAIRLQTRKRQAQQNSRQLRASQQQVLQSSLQAFCPQHVYTGNDRRFEFQWLMHLLAQQQPKVVGHYLDDGSYSYMGFPQSGISNFLEAVAKRVWVGSWWQHPPTIGASRWIQQLHLFCPAERHPLLQDKPCTQLTIPIQHACFQRLATHFVQQLPVPAQQIQCLVLLPHESVGSGINALLRLAEQQPGAVYKAHPRSQQPLDTKVTALPASLPVELLLPFLPSGCRVIGDASSALLTCRWLRADISVQALQTEQLSASWSAMLSRHGITFVPTTATAR